MKKPYSTLKTKTWQRGVLATLLLGGALLLPAAANATERIAGTPTMPAATNDSVRIHKEEPERENADRIMSATKVIFVNSGDGIQVSYDSVMKTISGFYLNQYRHFQDPLAPYFMFMSKDATMAMGLGGIVRMRAWFGWNSVVMANGLTPEGIPVPRDPAYTRRMSATPSGTGLFFTILGRNTPIGNYMGYFEANFDGYDVCTFVLQKAYFTLNDWTAGYATSSFADPAAQPPTIDNSGPCGKFDRANILVRYMHGFGKSRQWNVGASLEFPNSKIDDSAEYTEASPDYLPDVAVTGQYQWDDGVSHLRLSGLMRFLPYRDLLAQQNHTLVGWGVHASSVVKISMPLTGYVTVGTGQGTGAYASDMGQRIIDLIPVPGEPGHLKTPMLLGVTLGAKYVINANLYAALALSRLDYFPGAGALPDEYKTGSYAALSGFWNISPRVQVAGGYIYGRRQNADGQHSSANRVEAMFQLSF